MRVYCSGGPKSGTHALMKAVRLLLPKADIVHDHACVPAPDGCKQILILRNPKDCVVSWARRPNQVPPKDFTSDLLIQCITPGGGENDEGFWWHRMGSMHEYAERIRDLAAGDHYPMYTMHYEDLIEYTAWEFDNIAVYGLSLSGWNCDVWEKLLGDTASWVEGPRSDWTRCAEWTEKVEEVWVAQRGPEVCELLGYSNN